jgi:hypothetical protein
MVKLKYSEQPADLVTDESLKESAELFSSHYGTWGQNPFNLTPGARVCMSASKMKKDLLFNDTCYLAQARTADNIVVGHAFFCRFNIPDKVRLLTESFALTRQDLL